MNLRKNYPIHLLIAFILGTFVTSLICYFIRPEPQKLHVFRARQLKRPLLLRPSVFPPVVATNSCIREMRISPGDRVLDIGTGSGILSFLAIKAGAREVVATDINPEALAVAKLNARRLGMADKIRFVLVPTSRPGAYSMLKNEDPFDVIVTNPPFWKGEPKKFQDYAKLDPGYRLHDSIFKDLRQHLKPQGTLYLWQGIRSGINVSFDLAKKYGHSAEIICPLRWTKMDNTLRELTRRKFIVLFRVQNKK